MEQRTSQLHMRVTPSEERAFRAACARDGRTVSEAMRLAALAYAYAHSDDAPAAKRKGRRHG